MERYKMVGPLGDGTFGTVVLAQRKETGEKVAIKQMKRKYYSWQEALDLREIKSLKKIIHPHIIKLKEVIRENDTLYLVFEHMECNLYELMRSHYDKGDKGFPEPTVRIITYQVLDGLNFMHGMGVFHRDLKPENILCSHSGVIKIGDFGLARDMASRPPYTDYVSTRWYRAPEVLLQANYYSFAIDIWAIGCIMSEMYTFRPLFPGSSQIDQLFKICTIAGTPSQEEWPDGFYLAQKMNFRFPKYRRRPLESVVQPASLEALHLLSASLEWNPNLRPSAKQALSHAYFTGSRELVQKSTFSRSVAQENHEHRGAEPFWAKGPPNPWQRISDNRYPSGANRSVANGNVRTKDTEEGRIDWLMTKKERNFEPEKELGSNWERHYTDEQHQRSPVRHSPANSRNQKITMADNGSQTDNPSQARTAKSNRILFDSLNHSALVGRKTSNPSSSVDVSGNNDKGVQVPEPNRNRHSHCTEREGSGVSTQRKISNRNVNFRSRVPVPDQQKLARLDPHREASRTIPRLRPVSLPSLKLPRTSALTGLRSNLSVTVVETSTTKSLSGIGDLPEESHTEEEDSFPYRSETQTQTSFNHASGDSDNLRPSRRREIQARVDTGLRKF